MCETSSTSNASAACEDSREGPICVVSSSGHSLRRTGVRLSRAAPRFLASGPFSRILTALAAGRPPALDSRCARISRRTDARSDSRCARIPRRTDAAVRFGARISGGRRARYPILAALESRVEDARSENTVGAMLGTLVTRLGTSGPRFSLRSNLVLPGCPVGAIRAGVASRPVLEARRTPISRRRDASGLRPVECLGRRMRVELDSRSLQSVIGGRW